ncbi:MAG: hypothetical protein ACJAWS_002496 [Oleiphilaceae bacterium]|jgi:hypothetical protein
MVRVIILLILLSSTVQANKKVDTSEINISYQKEVCTLVLKKLKSSFESLRTGKITDSKTAKVANLLQSYRLLNCADEKKLFDVLACTNSQVMFFDDCRKLHL